MRSGLTSSSRQQQTLNFTIGPVGASATDLTLGLYYTGNISVTWNPGIISSTYSSNTNTQRIFTQSYISTGATGTIRGNVNLIRRISTSSPIDLTVPVSETSKLHTLEELSVGSSLFQSWVFDVSKLPSVMTSFSNRGLNTSFGSIGSTTSSNLPSGLTSFSMIGLSTITGHISNLPSQMTFFSVSNPVGYTSNFNLTGNINSLPSGIQNITIQGNLSTISGNIANLASLNAMSRFIIYGLNTITGDIVNIPSNVDTFNVRGNNTISGDIANIPPSVTYFYLAGNNNISGDISTLKSSLLAFYVPGGANTITGEIGSLAITCPSITNFSVYGRNQINGNIVNFPATLSNFNIYGYNVINGSLADIKPALRQFFWRSFGVITGNINTIPSGLLQCSINVLTSNIYPAGPSAGTCTVFGNLADIPNSVNYFSLQGGIGTLTYTGKTWPVMDYFSISQKATYGLTQSQVDALLIDLAIATWSGSSKYLYLGGSNAAPSYSSPAVAAAIATLTVKVNTLILTP